MTDERIKQEQWYVKELIYKINNKTINKPKFQRKRKWDILPKKENTPNEQSYIKFLFRRANTVHAITFGQYTKIGNIYLSNIDGNNRINAIKHFIDNPFDIFPEYLKNLENIIDELKINEYKIVKEIKEVFKTISYQEIISIKYTERYFKEKEKENLYIYIKCKCLIIDEEVENIQKKLKIKEVDNFDSNVKINVNIFEGYTTDELCKTFEDINKFNSHLTETELLACRLYEECNFKIKDNIFKSELQKHIKEYYDNKSKDEVLECYIYNIEENEINAYDFIVGFQNLCNSKYDIIEKTDFTGLSLFFKLYKVIYKDVDKQYIFNTKNINDFIDKITYSCEIFKEIISIIFTDKINEKLFNNSCKKKIFSLKKNNMFMLLCSIIGFKNKNKTKSFIKNEIEKTILYHFMIHEVKDKDKREEFKHNDSISYEAGGSFLDYLTKKLLENPESISIKLSQDNFKILIEYLYSENNNPHERKLDNGNYKNDKRRILKFYEKTLMFYYYKQKMPTNMLEYEFSIEHICPNSSDWKGELDKDRIGNLIPIISTINSSRSNKHINHYKDIDKQNFCNFIKDIIPSDTIYNGIISHKNNKPLIINIQDYNNMCIKNEMIYKENFIKCIYNLH